MPAISPDGTKVAMLADASTIYVYDLATKKSGNSRIIRRGVSSQVGPLIAVLFTSPIRAMFRLLCRSSTLLPDSGNSGKRSRPRILQAWDFIYPVMVAPNGQPMLMA